MPYLSEKYAAINEMPVYKTSAGKKKVNALLLGTWVGVKEEQSDYYKVVTAGPDGWVKKADVIDHKHLKVFYIDVGQGDATLIEVGDKKIIVDGGPGKHLRNYLTYWQYSYILDSRKKVHIDAVIISHFDADHYVGLNPIFEDTRFTFGTVYTNGIARFNPKKTKRPTKYNRDLGETFKVNDEEFLSTQFNSLTELTNLQDGTGLQKSFNKFVEALKKAKSENRLDKVELLTAADDVLINETVNNLPFEIKILGPVLNTVNGNKVYKWFKDSSHTRNGHSVVFKLTYGKTTLLFGGDLNSHSEHHLMHHYENETKPFRVDVTKCCHHGSSDFTVEFLKQVKPYATVISSGDNESYSHPQADTIGSAGRYSRGKRPKVYSTELARSINSSGEILFGMINLRSNGKRIYMAQMKERRSSSNIWDSYKIK